MKIDGRTWKWNNNRYKKRTGITEIQNLEPVA